MIEPSWYRIAGLHLQEDGTSAAVWIAINKTADTAHLYDCCVFRREVLAVIAEGLNARGRWIPISWEKKAQAMADRLLDRGCNMLVEPNVDDPAMAEQISRDIWGRMRSGRFRVDKRMSEWLDEFKDFRRSGSKVPIDSHPLMAATRHAIAMVDYGRREAIPGSRKPQAPKVAIV